MEQKGFNKSILSKRSGVPYTTIFDMYKKGYGNVKMTTVFKIADALDVSVDYLLRDEITDPAYRSQFPAADDLLPLSEVEETLVRDYRSLVPDGKAYIQQQMTIARALYTEKNYASSDVEEAQ